MDKKHVGEIIDCWIDEVDLPQRVNLKPIRRFDDLYPKDEAEREAYWDFVHWYLSQEFQALMSIPKPPEQDFWMFEHDDSISFPYSSIDYQRLHPFNRFAYKLRKIYERVEDLALLHSCISEEEGKANITKRFNKLVKEEFRNKAVMLLENYRRYPHLINKQKLFVRIANLDSRIQRCKSTWLKYVGRD
jgi:hypothetical protein